MRGRSVWIASMVLLVQTWASAGDLPFTTDFEEGNLRGWSATGTAFAVQPTRGDNPTVRGHLEPVKQQGQYWIGSYEKYSGKRWQQAGDVQGDAPMGRLVSEQFTIPDGELSFLLGGGSGFRTRVVLYVINGAEEGIPALRASGQNSETMERVRWDLTPFAGKRGYLAVIDESADAWGHINVDDFRFSAIAPDAMQTGAGSDATAEAGEISVSAAASEPAGAQETGALLTPKVLRVKHGERAVFTYDAHDAASEILRAHQGNQKGYQYVFETKDMEPAKYYINLKVTDVKLQESRTASAVLYVEALPGQRVKVPEVAGKQKKAAMDLIEEAGLRVGTVEERFSSLEPGTVISQSPKPGTVMKSGSGVVNLVIAKAEPVVKPKPVVEPVVSSVIVPELVGMDQQEVAALLEDEGLRVGTVEEQESDLKPGTVLSQYPEAGTALKPGSTVNLVVAKAGPMRLEVSATVDYSDVTLQGAMTPRQENVEYRFDFGDGYQSGWQQPGLSLHRYAAPGDYRAVVEARVGEVIFKQDTTVRVLPWSYTLQLKADPSEKDGTVRLHATLTPSRDTVRYSFDFGDGDTPAVQQSGDATHRYSSGGMYRIDVRATIDGTEVKEHLFVTVPDQGVPPLLYGILGLLGLLGGGWYYGARQKPENPEELDSSNSAFPRGSAPWE